MKDKKMIKAFVAASLAATAAMFPKKKKASRKLTLVQEIEEVIPKFGCQAAHVAELVSVMLKKKVTAKKKDEDEEDEEEDAVSDFPMLAGIVPLENPNGHNYTIGRTIVRLTENDDAVFVESDGESGNHMARSKDAFRAATRAELEEFFKRLPDSAVSSMLILAKSLAKIVK